MDKVTWNPELINRYDLSGPRYTSYPTAPQFKDNFTEAAVAAAIARGNNANTPLSLYFHIPFCDTVCYYCACNKVITANKARAQPYLETLFEEMAMVAGWVNSDRVVEQLHWGGGTPTYISDTEKRELMAQTRRLFRLRDDDRGDYSIEVHPGRMATSTISVLRELGFNRLSMGVQDFHPAVQQAVNRYNSLAEVRELLDVARAEAFHSISMDLIYGLPEQTLATFAKTLDQVIALSPDRLSLFNYAHMPHLFKTQRQIDASRLPSAGVKLKILENAIASLTQAGYVYIGMDHFAKPDDSLAQAQAAGELHRNFQGYATHGNCDLLAFGVSAISAIDNIFVQNQKDIPGYTRAIKQGALPVAKGAYLNHDDQLRQYVIKQIICQFALDFDDVARRFDLDFTDYFAPELAELASLASDGLVAFTDRGLRVTPEGRLLVRRICMVFDAYLTTAAAPVGYSRII